MRQGQIIWGQRIPGIHPFDPSHHVGREPHYSVIHLATSESLCVSQNQAFSGRDDDVEEWGSRLAALPTSSVVVSATPFWGPRLSPSDPYGRDGTVPVSRSSSPLLQVPRRTILQSSPLLSEAESMRSYFTSAGCYRADYAMAEYRPSTSTSFLHQSTPLVTTGPSAYFDSATYPSHFGDTVGFHHPSATTDFFTAPQQMLPTPISALPWSDGSFFGTQDPISTAWNSSSLATGPLASPNAGGGPVPPSAATGCSRSQNECDAIPMSVDLEEDHPDTDMDL